MFYDAISLLLLSMLAIGSLTDIRAGRIPNLLTLPFALAGITIHTFSAGLDGLLFGLAGYAAGIGVLIVPYLMSCMGAGDVKLMGAVGASLGAKATLEAFLLIAIAGGIYSLALIFIRRDVFKGFFREKLMVLSSRVMLRQYVPIQTQTESSGQKPRLKYGVAIAFGTIFYLLLKSHGIKIFV